MARTSAAVTAWPRRVTSLIGQQIKRHRQGRITARELADRCEQLGHRVETQVIANMEAGRRTNVSAADLFVLARALDVPPVALMFPVGEVGEVEVLPDCAQETWDALRWFTGEGPQEFSSRDELEAWRTANEPLRLYRLHQRLLDELRETRRRMNRALATRVLPDSTDSERGVAAQVMDAEVSTARQLEGQLTELRQQMRGQGITPPPLPDGLTYLDPEVSAP